MYFDPQRPPLIFSFPRSYPATPRSTQPFGPPILGPPTVVSRPCAPEEHARAASPQPHRCAECAELKRQVDDLRRENELLQVELETARISKDDANVGDFIASVKNKVNKENVINQVGVQKPTAVSVPPAELTGGIKTVDLSQLSFAEISELRHLRRAPQPVAKTLEALATTLSYSSSDELLADASLVSKLKAFADKVDSNGKKAIWKKIQRNISDLTAERVLQCNRPAGLLFTWLIQTLRPN